MPVAPALTCRRKIGAERPAGAALRILVVFSFGIGQNGSGKRRANRERRHSTTEAVLSRKASCHGSHLMALPRAARKSRRRQSSIVNHQWALSSEDRKSTRLNSSHI